jgi:hypothetical protein
MALRIDEYGHIIRDDDTSTQVNITSSTQDSGDDQLYVPADTSSLNYVSGARDTSESSTPILEISTPWYGGDGVFWTITMILSLAVALPMSIAVAPLIFEISGGSSDFLESLSNFFFIIAPYAIFLGTFVGSIWYNSKGTKKTGSHYHAAHEYVVSPLCAIAGAVGTGLLLFLLAIAVPVIAAIVAIGFVFAIFAGFVSGG